MYDDSRQELEHFGIKGMKWGIRRTPEQLGHASSKARTPNERWKSKKIRAIDKVYNKTYRQLDKAAEQNPNDRSISKYRKQLKQQHKRDIRSISGMTYMDIQKAKRKESQDRKDKVKKAVESAADASLWTAKMALTLTRIGGMALMVDIAANAGSTVLGYLDTAEGRKTVQTGAKIIDLMGHDALNTMGVAQNKLNSEFPDLGLPTGGLNDVLSRTRKLHS